MPETKRVLFLMADGARPDVLEEGMRSGFLPELAKLFLTSDAPIRRAATTMPSATGPAYLPYLTGRQAGAVNIPGIRWFDRFAYSNRKWFQAKRSYVGLGTRYWNQDLEPTIKTLFQYERDHSNIYNPIARGVRPGRDHVTWARAWYSPAAKYFGKWRSLDRRVAAETRAALDAGTKLIVAAFMGIDENSHDHGVHHDETLAAYRHLDDSVGDFVRLLHEKGELDRTRIVLGSDHGLSDTEHHFPLAEFVQEHGYKPIYYPRIWRWRPNAAVMVSGNSLAHIYLQKRGSWTARPRGSALWAEHGDLLNALARHESVHLLCYRDDDGSIVVQRGEDRCRFRISDGIIRFQTKGENPLGLPADLQKIGEREFFEQSWAWEYPDAAAQLTHLFEAPRCGDVVVMSRPGHDLRLRFEVPRHHASHGSLHRDHLLVPLLINDPELASGPCRTVDAFPYILEQLGHRSLMEIEGRMLPRIVPPEPVVVPAAASGPESAPTATAP